MVKRTVTVERLSEAAKAASKKILEHLAKDFGLKALPDDVATCEYLGTVEDGAPLNSLTRVKFQWTLRGELFHGSVPYETIAAKALHASVRGSGLRLPWECKVPLRVIALPPLIAQKKLVPSMSNREEVNVHGLVIPKDSCPEQETAFVVHGGHRQEFLKVAHVAGTTWLCHPGGVLNPNGLVLLDIQDGPLPKEPRGPIYRLPRTQQGELLHKLYAVAHFKAEVLRTKMEGSTVSLQTVTKNFKGDALQWGRVPKNVFVIWSHRTPKGTREYELSELPYKGIR